jgi:predicted N-formylglutamate amidohydrolase
VVRCASNACLLLVEENLNFASTNEENISESILTGPVNVKKNFHMLLDEPNALTPEQVVSVHNQTGDHRLVLVCEHASNWIPPAFRDLGLESAALISHVAWDPGALGVAEKLSEKLNAPLVFGRVSRLVYDCNRPPEAEDAIPAVSEIIAVPGNTGLTAEQRSDRVETVYHPFRRVVEAAIAKAPANAVLVTVHSFTPVYHGHRRTTEIGILHGEDPRLARAMISIAGAYTDRRVRLNDPYGPSDGVSHTLNLHGCANGLANVMIEIRNDLIKTPGQQETMADELGRWLPTAIAGLAVEAGP